VAAGPVYFQDIASKLVPPRDLAPLAAYDALWQFILLLVHRPFALDGLCGGHAAFRRFQLVQAWASSYA